MILNVTPASKLGRGGAWQNERAEFAEGEHMPELHGDEQTAQDCTDEGGQSTSSQHHTLEQRAGQHHGLPGFAGHGFQHRRGALAQFAGPRPRLRGAGGGVCFKTARARLRCTLLAHRPLAGGADLEPRHAHLD